MSLAEEKIKKQTRCLFEQLDLEAAEASNLNINIILSGLLKDFQILFSLAGFSATALEVSSSFRDSF